MSTGEVIVKVMALLRSGKITTMTTNREVYDMVSDKKDLNQIEHALEWYEGTDGSEREEASEGMYKILLNLYNQELKWKTSSKKQKQKSLGA